MLCFRREHLQKFAPRQEMEADASHSVQWITERSIDDITQAALASCDSLRLRLVVSRPRRIQRTQLHGIVRSMNSERIVAIWRTFSRKRRYCCLLENAWRSTLTSSISFTVRSFTWFTSNHSPEWYRNYEALHFTWHVNENARAVQIA